MRYVPLIMLKMCRILSPFELCKSCRSRKDCLTEVICHLICIFLLVVCDYLEWHSYSEMKCEISVHVRVEYWIVFIFRFVSWIYCFHSHVEAQDEIAEVQADPQSIGNSNLFVESVKMELSAWLFLVFSQCPNISCINECRSV